MYIRLLSKQYLVIIFVKGENMNRKKKKEKNMIDIMIAVCLVIFDILILLGFISWYLSLPQMYQRLWQYDYFMLIYKNPIFNI